MHIFILNISAWFEFLDVSLLTPGHDFQSQAMPGATESRELFHETLHQFEISRHSNGPSGSEAIS